MDSVLKRFHSRTWVLRIPAQEDRVFWQGLGANGAQPGKRP